MIFWTNSLGADRCPRQGKTAWMLVSSNRPQRLQWRHRTRRKQRPCCNQSRCLKSHLGPSHLGQKVWERGVEALLHCLYLRQGPSNQEAGDTSRRMRIGFSRGWKR
ncbi:unnamed protein product [Arctogadus glacialis]